MTDLAELIQAEHVRISRVIGQFNDALAAPCAVGAGPEAGLIWDVLAGFLWLHVDAAEEIAYSALTSADPDAAMAVAQASEANTDIREAMAEARLSRVGSRTWHMAVRAACRAAQAHIACEESDLLVRYRRHAAPAVRRAAGRQWVCFTTAWVLDGYVQRSPFPVAGTDAVAGEADAVAADAELPHGQVMVAGPGLDDGQGPAHDAPLVVVVEHDPVVGQAGDGKLGEPS